MKLIARPLDRDINFVKLSRLLFATFLALIPSSIADAGSCAHGSPDDRIAGCSELLSKPNLSVAQRASALDGRCWAYNEKGDYPAALQDCSKAIKLKPSYYYAYNNRGVALEKLGRTSDALINYQMALRLRPNFGVARDNYERLSSGHSQNDNQPISHSGNSELVRLIPSHGTLLVPVTINNEITLKFTVDSGASDVSIPADVVSTLIRTGSISDSDFIGSQTYILADGSRVPSATFNIRSLRVGNKTLKNVVGSVASAKGSLLLGQSFLKRFNSWSIDNGRGVLILND